MTDLGNPISWVRSLPRTLDADFGTGVSFPVGQTRFVWTHLATAESSLASWRSASRLTSTFQSQLFHVCLASNGRYGPTTHRPPVQAMELLAFAFRSFHLCASWRTCRLKPASFELTMPFLSQAWPLGGLHRASPLPFRASYFTSGLHPPDATAQRLIAYLYKRWSYRSSSFTHSIFALRSAHRSFPPDYASA